MVIGVGMAGCLCAAPALMFKRANQAETGQQLPGHINIEGREGNALILFSIVRRFTESGYSKSGKELQSTMPFSFLTSHHHFIYTRKKKRFQLLRGGQADGDFY